MKLGSKFHLKIPMAKSEKQRCIVQLQWVLVKLFHLRTILYNQTKYIFWTIIHWFWQAKPSSIHSFDQTHKNLMFFFFNSQDSTGRIYHQVCHHHPSWVQGPSGQTTQKSGPNGKKYLLLIKPRRREFFSRIGFSPPPPQTQSPATSGEIPK